MNLKSQIIIFFVFFFHFKYKKKCYMFESNHQAKLKCYSFTGNCRELLYISFTIYLSSAQNVNGLVFLDLEVVQRKPMNLDSKGFRGISIHFTFNPLNKSRFSWRMKFHFSFLTYFFLHFEFDFTFQILQANVNVNPEMTQVTYRNRFLMQPLILLMLENFG